MMRALGVVAWGYFVQPPFLRGFWGVALGELLRLLKLRSQVVRQNLELAFPGDSPGAVRTRETLYRQAYHHLGKLVFEILMLFGPMRSFVLRNTDLRGIEHWQQASARGKGVFFLSSHVGNWEIMSAVGGLKGGIDLMLVTKRLKPAWLHEAIQRGRLKCKVKATYEPRTMRDLLAHIKSGGTVGFVLDQYAGPPVGVRVPVFGVPVGTSTALAILAKRTGAPVLPVVNYRGKDGRWVVEIRPPASWHSHPDPTHELAINTANYAASVEKDIYAHPDQWLWTHRRFKGDLTPLREGEWAEGRPRR